MTARWFGGPRGWLPALRGFAGGAAGPRTGLRFAAPLPCARAGQDRRAAKLATRLRQALFPWLFALASAGVAADGLQGRLVVGYQGWFGCPGDFQGNREWQHWFQGAPAADRLTVDQLPATDAFRREDLCDTGLKRSDGAPVYVFSSQNARVVDQHLRWMKQHGIDALAFQRFVAHTLGFGGSNACLVFGRADR